MVDMGAKISQRGEITKGIVLYKWLKRLAKTMLTNAYKAKSCG